MASAHAVQRHFPCVYPDWVPWVIVAVTNVESTTATIMTFYSTSALNERSAFASTGSAIASETTSAMSGGRSPR